jgi:hypothetical protein
MGLSTDQEFIVFLVLRQLRGSGEDDDVRDRRELIVGVTGNGPPLSVGSVQEQEQNRSGECLRGDLNSGELASTDR